MANKRMFSKTITESDAFLGMPLSAQCLYFHLSMAADDDGFINSPKKIQWLIGAAPDDLNILLENRFVIGFPSGVVVIKHWRLNNYIKNDRHKKTVYDEEFDSLLIKENGVYSEKNVSKCVPDVFQNVSKCAPNVLQNVSKVETQNRLDKNSIEESSKEEESIGEVIGEGEETNSVTFSASELKGYSCLTDREKILADYFVMTGESKETVQNWIKGRVTS